MQSNNRCFDRVKAGAYTGGIIGLVIGTLYGGYGVIRIPNATMGQRFNLLARTVIASSVTFGFFLAVGSAIRCEQSAPSISYKGYSTREDLIIQNKQNMN